MTVNEIREHLEQCYINPTFHIPVEARDWNIVRMCCRAYIDALMHCGHIGGLAYDQLVTWLYRTVDTEERRRMENM